MFVPFADRLARVAGALLLAGCVAHGTGVAAQSSGETRTVVSKSVSVGSDAASLALEFGQGPALEIRLQGGEVRVDGEVVGAYTPGGPAWEAWRGLLGFAVALDDGPLGRTLLEWSPPEELSGGELDVARLLDRTLDERLAAPPAPVDAPGAPPAAAPPAPGAPPEVGVGMGSLADLLARRDRLPGLAEALDGLDLEDLNLTVGEDRVVGREVQLDGTLVVVDGDLDVEGTVRGDVVVVGGDLRIGSDARIEGEVRIADGRLVRQGGEVDDGVRIIEGASGAPVDVESLRDQIRDEIRSEIRAATRESRDRSRRGPLSEVFDTIGGLIGNIFSILVLGIVGALVVHFAGPNFDAVAQTARRTPGRALAVGTAGAFLLLPAWVIGILILAVSIIGIPALILWIPLFPVAAVLAGGLGYLAVARNVGAWLTRQDYPYTSWVRITNPVTLVMGGALVLSLGFIAENLIGILPFTGALEVLLTVASSLLSGVAILIGFGAVLLTRGGRRPEFYDDDLFGGSGDPWPWSAPPGPETPPSGAGEGAATTGGDASASDEAAGPAPEAAPSPAEPEHPAADHGIHDDEEDDDDRRHPRGDGDADDPERPHA